MLRPVLRLCGCLSFKAGGIPPHHTPAAGAIKTQRRPRARAPSSCWDGSGNASSALSTKPPPSRYFRRYLLAGASCCGSSVVCKSSPHEGAVFVWRAANRVPVSEATGRAFQATKSSTRNLKRCLLMSANANANASRVFLPTTGFQILQAWRSLTSPFRPLLRRLGVGLNPRREKQEVM